jgi:predicted  nucleic acid-binding Zn-ribbon protein
MSKALELLLQLEGLVLVKRGLQLAGPQAEALGLDHLEEKINRLRRQVPGPVLSLFDQLARQYADPLTALADGVCQGCHQPLPPRHRRRAVHSNGLLQCAHCGRLLFAAEEAPDYVP